jgi:hypothetical protein
LSDDAAPGQCVVLLTLAGAAVSALAQYPDPAKWPMRASTDTIDA